MYLLTIALIYVIHSTCITLRFNFTTQFRNLTSFPDLAQVVQKMDNAIHKINHYAVVGVVCFVNTYPLDSDLSAG